MKKLHLSLIAAGLLGAYLSTLFLTLFHWLWLGQRPLLGEGLGALLVALGMFGRCFMARGAGA